MRASKTNKEILRTLTSNSLFFRDDDTHFYSDEDKLLTCMLLNTLQANFYFASAFAGELEVNDKKLFWMIDKKMHPRPIVTVEMCID